MVAPSGLACPKAGNAVCPKTGVLCPKAVVPKPVDVEVAADDPKPDDTPNPPEVDDPNVEPANRSQDRRLN